MKHIKLFEEYQSFDDHTGFGTAGRDLKSDPPLVDEEFLVPGFVKTELDQMQENSELTLKPGDLLKITGFSKTGFSKKRGKSIYPFGIVDFTVNDKIEHTCDVKSFIELLTYDISGDNLSVISPEEITKRIPSWRGRMAGKKFGF